FSFNEPIIWLEYIIDVFKLCKTDIYQMLVTNGYMSLEALDLLIDTGMTGMTVTVKGSTDIVKKFCGSKVDLIWQNIERAYKKDVHIEIICLIIPRVNDSIEFFKHVSENICNIDPNIPLHFTRFFPDYKFNNVNPTPISKLEEAYTIATQQGVNYVYLGNVFGHPLENTYCPACNELLIKRVGYEIKINLNLTNKCPSCGKRIPVYR
ncbi:MAG: radical SAM protein, partial [Candidatus Hodarchaeota archaeon]